MNATGHRKRPRGDVEVLKDEGKLSGRKARLLAVACCRRIWHLLTDERSRRAVEVAEGYADGRDGRKELRAAWRALSDIHDGGPRESSIDCALHAVSYTCRSLTTLSKAATMASWAVFYAEAAGGEGFAEAERAERSLQCFVLRELVNPLLFCPPPLAPSVLAWNAGTVVRLARAAYEERELPSGHLDRQRLAVLADAVEEAGGDAELVAHLRHPGPHYRGCHAVDLLLAKS